MFICVHLRLTAFSRFMAHLSLVGSAAAALLLFAAPADAAPPRPPDQPGAVRAAAGAARHAAHCAQCHERQSPAPKVSDVEVQTTLTHTMVGLPSASPRPVVSKLAAETAIYLASLHARASKKDPARPNATCGDCPRSTAVTPLHGEAA